MDIPPVFLTVSLVMLANGAALAIATSSLPVSFRPAAIYWQIGTLLIALGCLSFAFGATQPSYLIVTLANALMVFGLTGYHWALQHFSHRRPRLIQLLPAVLATLWALWFSTVNPDFKVRVAGAAIVWLYLMLACFLELVRKHPDATSRKMLASIFALAMICVVARALAYIGSSLAPSATLMASEEWLNPMMPLFLPLLPIIGTTAFILMCTERLRHQLQVSASTDYLTTLPNRRTLVETGKARFERARKLQQTLAVALLDVDGFKSINDAFGHEIGDKALLHVAERLRGATRGTDMIARTGGEEFVALLDNLKPEDALAAVERLRASVEEKLFSDGAVRARITVSIGLAILEHGDETFEAVLRRADAATYIAKAEGRNRVKLAA